MYNIVQSYPGFKSPGAWIDQTAFMLQNGALDIGSFGLPKLADQAIKDGNEEGAEKAIQTSRALFWIMISNLVWGGIEHVLGSGVPDGWKTFVALAFLVVRAYYAISYTKVVHALKKAEDDEEEDPSVQDPAASPVAATIDYTVLVDLLKPHLQEIRASLAVDLKPVPVDLDYVALTLAVAPHIEARSASVDLEPVPALTQVDLSPVALTESQVDSGPVEPASSPVALASTQVDLSPVPPKEPGPAPRSQVQSNGSQVAPTGGSELEKGGPGSSRAGSGSTKSGSESTKASVVAPKSGNEERDLKLEMAYAALVAEGIKISARALAPRAGCGRPAATEWLQIHHASGPESSRSGSATSGPESSGSGAGTDGSDEVDLNRQSRVRNTDELMAMDLGVSHAG